MSRDVQAPAAAGSTGESASQWRLIWWKFRQHKLAMLGLLVVSVLYLIALFAGFFAPFDPNETNRRGVFHPPQAIHFWDRTEAGLEIGPYVYRMERKRHPISLKVTYETSGEKVPLKWFARGAEYRLFGLFTSNLKLLTTEDPRDSFFLFGADRLGRDMLSRTIYGAQLSLSIGLVGIAFSLFLGLLLGGLSGYFGGVIDIVIQRFVELVLSLPTIPIWLAVAAALPTHWSIEARYFTITLIVSLVGWTELARIVRGRFLSLRHEDFVVAARLDNASELRIVFRHMLPSLTSHIIASVTLAVPLMIIAETSLSFLGLGLLPPSISWGVLLKEAQDIRSIATAPWLFIPGGAVVATVLAFNFFGDGLRDAADPYAS